MKSIINYISIICVLIAFSACAEKNNKEENLQVFRYNENANIQTLDPAFARNMAIIWPCNQLFNGLVQLDDSLHIQPDIAKYWTISEDGLTYDFVLRNDVYFHNHPNFGKQETRNVVGKDFEYSLNRLIDPKVASPGAWILQKVESFNAMNDSVFQIRLKEPFPAFLGLLSMRYASVVPKEVIEDTTHDFRTNPIGTGPFYFKFWEENVKLVLRKNDNYFEKDKNGIQLPYLDAVAITFLPDKQSAFLQFIQGNLDFLSGLDPSYSYDILEVDGVLRNKYKAIINMETGPYLNTEYLGFNMDAKNAIADKRIRQALNISFDREKMILHLRNGLGTFDVGSIVPKGLQGTIDQSVNELYNVEKAKALVEEYKKEKNTNEVVIELSTNSGYLNIAEFLQREWQKIGIKVSIDVMPPATLRQGMSSGKIDFFRGSWIADYPDAENYLSLFYSKNKAPNGPNYTFFDNKKYDLLYEKAITVVNERERISLYKDMQQILIEEVPVIILYYDTAIRFSQKNIDNLGINPMNNLFLKKVSKKQNY